MLRAMDAFAIKASLVAVRLQTSHSTYAVRRTLVVYLSAYQCLVNVHL